MAQATMIRPATADDIPAIRAILAAYDNDGPVTTVDVVGPYVRHLVTRHRALVGIDGGAVVGYGAVVDAGLAHHLADLFVVPDRLGRGIGRALLEALFLDAPRRTTFASNDPRALPLYIRAGMTPLWPALYLEGAGEALPEPHPSLGLEAADATRLAGLEAAWTGHARATDHRFWAGMAEADGFVVLDAGEPVAFAYARARQVSAARAIDRMLVRPGADPVAPILAALRRAARGGPVTAILAGPNPAVPRLLDAGFRITERDDFCASDPDLVDPARRLSDGGML